MKRIRSVLLWAFGLWTAGCFAFFLFAALTTMMGAPRGLPLPWSDFQDFVESPDGRVFVKISFHNRVLSYDRQGRFVASYPYPPGGKKDTELAVSEDNRVFFRSRNHVSVLSTSWEVLDAVERDYREERSWELDQEGRPAHAPRRAGEKGSGRPVKRGEMLFPKEMRGLAVDPRRKVFHNADGSTLRKVGNSLERRSKEDDVTARYGSLWIYKPFEFPLPGGLAWLSLFALAFGIAWRKRRRSRMEMRRPVAATSPRASAGAPPTSC